MAFQINSSGVVKTYNSVSDQIKNVGEDISSLAKSLSNNNSDKSIDIVETKLLEYVKELEAISSDITNFSKKIIPATNQVNEELRKAEATKV